MAKKKKPAPEPVAKPPVSFEVDGVIYTEGDTLQIIAPELGLISVKCKFHDYSNSHIVSFHIGWVKTPLPCKVNERPDAPNATMHFTATRLYTGPGYKDNDLHLIYFCTCRDSVHTRQFRWYDVTFENGVIRANTLGQTDRGGMGQQFPHNHPIVEGYEHLKPVIVQPVEVPITRPFVIGTQLQLF